MKRKADRFIEREADEGESSDDEGPNRKKGIFVFFCGWTVSSL